MYRSWVQVPVGSQTNLTMENKYYLENILNLVMSRVLDLFSVPKTIVRIPGNALANETSDIYHVKPKKKKFGEKKLSKKQRKCKQKQ